MCCSRCSCRPRLFRHHRKMSVLAVSDHCRHPSSLWHHHRAVQSSSLLLPWWSHRHFAWLLLLLPLSWRHLFKMVVMCLPPSSSFHQKTGGLEMSSDRCKNALSSSGDLHESLETIFNRIWVKSHSGLMSSDHLSACSARSTDATDSFDTVSTGIHDTLILSVFEQERPPFFLCPFLFQYWNVLSISWPFWYPSSPLSGHLFAKIHATPHFGFFRERRNIFLLSLGPRLRQIVVAVWHWLMVVHLGWSAECANQRAAVWSELGRGLDKYPPRWCVVIDMKFGVVAIAGAVRFVWKRSPKSSLTESPDSGSGTQTWSWLGEGQNPPLGWTRLTQSWNPVMREG